MRGPRTLGAYGIVLVLGLFGATGFVRACAPPPAVTAVSGITADCVSRVNVERAKVGLRAVTLESRVQSAAQKHSNYQASISTMTHVSANGWHAGDRLHAEGYTWHAYGENVAAGQVGCASVMSAWMASAGHRANILNGTFIHIGVAAAKNSGGTYYWTMDLAAP